MFIAAIMGGAIVVGYVVTVAISLLLTFAVAASLPKFVEADHLVRDGYKIVHELFWLVAAVAGGYTASVLANGIHPLVTQGALMAALIWVLWSNSWEARQRGTAHQILITIFTAAGVAGGYFLQSRVT